MMKWALINLVYYNKYMNEKDLRKMLDEAEMMGYKRGALTMIAFILKEMEAQNKTMVTIEVLKEIKNSYDKNN